MGEERCIWVLRGKPERKRSLGSGRVILRRIFRK